jgi:hypothetical protein
MEIRAYQEREPDDAQICTFAFGVPTLGEYSVVLSIDEGVEIGGIKEQGLQVNFEVFNQPSGKVFFDLADRGLVEISHVIPEPLA